MRLLVAHWHTVISQRRYGRALAGCGFFGAGPSLGYEGLGDSVMAGLLHAAVLQICLLVSRASDKEARPSTRHNQHEITRQSNLTMEALGEHVLKNNPGHSWVLSSGTRCCTLDPRNRHCHNNRHFHSNKEDEAGLLRSSDCSSRAARIASPSVHIKARPWPSNDDFAPFFILLSRGSLRHTTT